MKHELKAHEGALNIFKKGDGYFGQRRAQMIYQCVAEGKYDISVKAVLKILRVSTSGYYAWKRRKPSKQSLKKKITIEMVKEIHEESNEIYGAPKITIELHKRGISITERTVGLYMRESGLRAWY